MLLFIIGTCFGSFGCLIAERLPLNQSIISPPSHCPSCHTYLKFYDLIPIISYLNLNKKCRNCKASIPCASFYSELICGLAFVLIHYTDHAHLRYLPEITFLIIAFLLSLIDSVYFIVLPKLFYFGSGLTLFFIISSLNISDLHPISSLIIFLSLSLFSHINKQKLGQGDIKFLTFLSLITGIYHILLIMLIASFSAILYFIILYSKKQVTRDKKIPFIPFITLGYFIVFINWI